jgi:hypothetical protein
MEKLFRFSKIASLIVLLMAVVRVVSYFFNLGTIHVILLIAVEILFHILLLTYFLLIYRNSVAGSVLRCPSLIGVISATVGIVSFLGVDFYVYGFQTIYCISIISLCVSFMWIAKYMKPLPKVFGWLCAIIPIIITLFYRYFALDLFEHYYYDMDMYKYNQIVTLITYLLKYVVFVAFYYTFSKISTK